MSDSERMDWILAEHCAPALLGLKQSNLVTLSASKFIDLHAELTACANRLSSLGVTVRTLKCSPDCCIILVYWRALLERYLLQPDILKWLASLGYNAKASLENIILELASRISKHNRSARDFPHEIGVFLGYPLEDVIAFIHQGGKNSISSGVWKVYSHPDDAKKRFMQYRKASLRMLDGMKKGIPITQQLGHAA